METRETSAEIDAAAAEWAVRFVDGLIDHDEQAALDAWLAADSRRLGAYARARAVFAHARRAKALGSAFDPDSYTGGAIIEGSDTVEAIETAIDPPTRRRMLIMGGSAAVAASVVAAVGLSWRAAAHNFRTERGEIRLVPLEDGSSMTLNTASEATIAYSEHERRIELVEGEALFDVAKDAQRPFIVAAGDTRVRAVGTSFTVRKIAKAPIEVMVRQGEVEVARPTASEVTVKRVSANTRAVAIEESSSVVTAPVSPAEIGRELAWREGMLAFEDVPLRQAAQEFARYSDVRIFFADPAIGSETVTGLYAANNPTGFARSVAFSFGLRAEIVSDGVVLRR